MALAPLLTLLLAVAVGLERLQARALLGAVIAFAGAVLLTVDQVNADVPVLPLLAATGVIVKLTPQAHPVATNAVGMVSGGFLLVLLSFIAGETWAVPEALRAWTAMIYLVLGGSLAMFGLYVFVLSRWSASAVSYSAVLFPLATIALSVPLVGQAIGQTRVLGTAVVLLGVYLGAVRRG